MQYNLIIQEAEEGGFIGYVPEIPGAFTQGETQEEVKENIIEAINLLKEVRIEQALKEIGNKPHKIESIDL